MNFVKSFFVSPTVEEHTPEPIRFFKADVMSYLTPKIVDFPDTVETEFINK